MISKKSMTNEVIDTLHLDSRGVKDRLANEDMLKYTGVEKFNHKSFQLGSRVGFIDPNAVTNEVLFAQIRMLIELMFDVIPLSRYDHLVRNGGSKVFNNVFRVPVYDSEEWATMISHNADTIKGINIALAAKVTTKPAAAKTK